MDRRNRKPAGLVRAQALGEDAWACPRCGCRDWRVLDSYQAQDGTRHRRRCCRHCLFVRMSYESFERPNSGD